MLKKFIAGSTTVLFVLMLMSFAASPKGNQFETSKQFSDSADKKELVANEPAKDAKQEFKELFVAEASTGGVNYSQLNPQAVSFVEDYIEKNREDITEIRNWGKPYLDVMENILVQHGLPKELKYLAVIESNLKSTARSGVGAVGPWQFMPETARRMGLKVSARYDERKDITKSTHAASKYLSSLFDIYGDWLLVIAAYNGGAGRVNAAIKKSGSKDFWTLQRYLPTESKNHVKKFIATHYLLEGQGSIATVTKDEAKNMATASMLSAEELANTKTQFISGRYNSLVIAKQLEMDISAFNKMNPDFDRLVASGNNYDLRLPVDKMDVFISKKPSILNESIQLLLTGNANGETSRLN
jgi:membrane-bound lytic murein transglycosylase D